MHSSTNSSFGMGIPAFVAGFAVTSYSRWGQTPTPMSTYRDTVDFLLYDRLQVESLTSRERFADHSRKTFGSVLDTCDKTARERPTIEHVLF